MITGEPAPIRLAQRSARVPTETLTLHPLSDVHVGADAHDRDALLRRLKFIAQQDESHRIIAHGDWGDIRNKDGKSFRHGAMTPDEEFDLIVELLLPHASRIDLMMPGNHEDRIIKQVGFDWMAKLAAALGLYPACYSAGPAALKHTFGKNGERSVTGLIHHGYGGGKLPGASFNNVLALTHWYPTVDYTLMGHCHHNGSLKTVRYIGDPPKMHTVTHVLTGTYVSHEPYAQLFGMPPSWIGTPRILVGHNAGGADELINVVV